MRAVAIDRFGDPGVLAVHQVPDAPSPAAGQVRITVAAAAVNPVDQLVRRGAETGLPFPMVLGWDVAGVVESVGTEVERFAVGDPVIAMSAQAATGVGTWAERITLHQDLLAPAPTSIPLVDAAALPLAGLSCAQALDRLKLDPGDRVLVTGGVGALGGYAVQLGRHRGWRMSVVVRAKDRELAESLGAERVYTEVPRGAGYDALFETAGIAGAVDAVRDDGQMVSVVDGALPPAERGIRPQMSYVEQSGAALAHLAALVDRGVLSVRVAARISFDDAVEAAAMLEAGGVRGKVLLLP